MMADHSTLALCSVLTFIVWAFTYFPLFLGHESTGFYDFDLPEEHVKYYLNQRPDIASACRQDAKCPYRNILDNNTHCWGHEQECGLTNRSYSWAHLQCDDKITHWAPTMAEKRRLFWEEADFGYVTKRKKTMSKICLQSSKGGSSLRCTKFLEYCYGKNMFFDFRSLNLSKSYDRYREDVMHDGEVGANCILKSKRLHKYTNRSGYLQGWYNELKHFTVVDDFKIDKGHCDIIFQKPTIVMKLDAGISMYHHYCDFINLYASQHLNGSFDLDVNIVLWDTHAMGYTDFFVETWKAFSKNPLITMKQLDGKRVCFREVMMPFLARMFFGLYFNMPLISNCHGSGLAHAFSKHLLHRLRIKQSGPLLNQIRVTYLSRKTAYRRVLNSDEILERLRSVKEFKVTVVSYEYRKLPFLKQVEITHNTDVFMGVHGSGLTHMFFLPDWAALFEVYHCEDPECYKELAQIRGVQFFGWSRSDLVTHENETVKNKKFTNFWLNVDEFMRITRQAADYVRSHPLFRKARSKIRKMQNDEF